MDFELNLMKARADDKRAVLQIIEMYRPLIIHYSMVNGKFDEDLYQENVYTMLICIKKFPLEKHLLVMENEMNKHNI